MAQPSKQNFDSAVEYTAVGKGNNKKHSFGSWLLDSWCLEIAALTLSAACAITIAVILVCYDNRPVPNLRNGITLNAIVSVLATASKASLLFAVSSAIGQLKWTWLLKHESRPLIHAEIFDNASRGPLGAFQLLFADIRLPLASLGASIIILTLSFDPFVQLVIQYKPSLRFEEHAETTVSTGSYFRVSGSSLALERAIQSALYTDYYPQTPQCASANCTWTGIESLAWHTRCYPDPSWAWDTDCDFVGMNATWFDDKPMSDPEFQFSSCKAQTPTGLSATFDWRYQHSNDSISAYIPFYQVVHTWDVNSTSNSASNWMISFIRGAERLPNAYPTELIDVPLFTFAAFNVTSPTGLRDLELSATNCELDLFVDTYNLETVNGVSKVTDLVSKPLQKRLVQLSKRPPAVNRTSSAAMYVCFEPDGTPPSNFSELNAAGLLRWESSINSVVSSNPFSWCTLSLAATANILSVISANVTQRFDTAFNSTQDLDSGLGTTNRDRDLVINFDGVTADVYNSGGYQQVMHSLADSLTKLTLDPTANVNGTSTATGMVGVNVTLVIVRWMWLVLPYLICLASTVFVCCTIYIQRSTKAPLWKSSINAFFYHGIDFDYGIETRLETIPEMDAQASRTMVQLKPFGLQQRLMLETSLLRRQPEVDD